MTCPPVDGDVLHHLLSVCILQRDAPWRHCQNHLLKLASSDPCLGVEKHQQSLQTWQGSSSHPLARKSPADSVQYHSLGILAAKAPAVGMGQQSLAIRHALHRTLFESIHTTATQTGRDRPHLPQHFTLLSLLWQAQLCSQPGSGVEAGGWGCPAGRQLPHTTNTDTSSLLHATLVLGRAQSLIGIQG